MSKKIFLKQFSLSISILIIFSSMAHSITGRQIMKKNDALPEAKTAKNYSILIIIKGGRKIRKEFELEISDSETMKLVLKSLNLFQWLSTRKHRTIYELNGVYFQFDKYHDEYEFIPEFLEIEGENTRFTNYLSVSIHKDFNFYGYSISPSCKTRKYRFNIR